PFTLVPLPGLRSSLVFVVDLVEAPRLAALSDMEKGAEIERRSHSILGKVDVESGCGVFALGATTARVFGVRRIALVGEAAHVLPPIGAQGLNLGLRDAADIADVVRHATLSNEDPGSPPVLERYNTARRADVTSRTFVIDMANRSLLSDLLPVQS